jgi:excisionase family DNA binding protein
MTDHVHAFSCPCGVSLVTDWEELPLTEAATVLGRSPATLRQQIANGKLRGTKVGRDWWVTKGEVARYRRDSRKG